MIDEQFSIVAIHQVDEALARKRFGDVERGVAQAGELCVVHKDAVAPRVGREAVSFLAHQRYQRAGRSTEARARRVRLLHYLHLRRNGRVVLDDDHARRERLK